MNILAFDTATENCSVALQYGDEVLAKSVVVKRQHGQHLLPMIDQVLAQAAMSLSQLDALAFGRGPGSFTGVRMAASVVQGLAFSHDLPVIPVSVLQTLAQGAYRECACQRVLVALDARMSEVYWGAFVLKGKIMEPMGDESVLAPNDVPVPSGQGWFACGQGFQVYRQALETHVGQSLAGYATLCYPQADDMLSLAAPMFAQGLAVSAELALPVYIRDKVIN